MLMRDSTLLNNAIDLHTHTNSSDGVLSPEALVDYAADRGVAVLAVTDHDTVGGVDAACRAGANLGVTVVPGIEISTYYRGMSLHVLGLGIRPTDLPLTEMIERLGNARSQRSDRILSKLELAGVALSAADIARESPSRTQIGRPHIARALVNKGFARDFKSAFDEYLGINGSAYEEVELVAPEEAIRIVAAAGGMPVLAHPVTARLDESGIRNLLGELADMGLEGLETNTPAHTRTRKRFFRKCAVDLGLIETGGSDFHEPDCGRILGCGTGRGRLKIENFQPVMTRIFDAAVPYVIEKSISFNLLEPPGNNR